MESAKELPITSIMDAISNSFSSSQFLLSYPPPNASDRRQVRSGEVRLLPDAPPIQLDDHDIQIAVELSDDLNLNERVCARLLNSVNQEEWSKPLKCERAAGLWYSERRELLTALYTLLEGAGLNQEPEDEIVSVIQKYLKDLIHDGLRHMLISHMKELIQEERAALGGPDSVHSVLYSRDDLVERHALISRERLILGHCLFLSLLLVQANERDVEDILLVLKDTAAERSETNNTMKRQIAFTLHFSLGMALISDVVSKASVLSLDASFHDDFHEIVNAAGNDPNVQGFVNSTRLAWAVHLMFLQDVSTTSTASSSELDYLQPCLEAIFSDNDFQLILDKVLRTAEYQNDVKEMTYVYNDYLHNLITCFLSHSLARAKVKESKERAMSILSPYRMAGSHDFAYDSNLTSPQVPDSGSLPFISLLEFVSEIYQVPKPLSGKDVFWAFVSLAGEDLTNFQTLVAFLNMLSTLASSQEGASKVYELLQGTVFRCVGWSTLFDCLSISDEKFKQALQTTGAMLPELSERDAKALVAYLNVLQMVVENGDPLERKIWFPDVIDSLCRLRRYKNVPPYLKGALCKAIASLYGVSSSVLEEEDKKKNKKNHEEKKEVEQIFQCPNCSRVFTSSIGLSNHRRTHEPKEKLTFKCPNCSRSFSSSVGLSNHRRVHEPKKVKEDPGP